MKSHFNTQAMRKMGQLALAACIVFTSVERFGQAGALPALAAASTALAAKAEQRITVVGYDRSIRQQDFAGLSKPTVLRMQQQLEVIYRNLADWQHDFKLQERPLNDGIVGPVTLSWLQRYAFNFKITTGADVGKDFPAHMERMAAFALAHPSELAILLDKQFEEWDGVNTAEVKAQDFAVRRRADAAELVALVNRYRASRTASPPATTVPIDSDGFYTYVLQPEDLEVLGGKADIGAILAKFKDKPYASKEALKVALAQALKGRAHVLGKVWPVIDKNVRPFDGYLLNTESRSSLKKVGMSDSTLNQLTALGTVYLKSRADFDTYIIDKTTSGDLDISDDALVQLATNIEVLDNFHLDQQALDTIEKQLSGSIQYVGLPGGVVKMLEQIKEVDYPDAAIFHSAAKSKIAYGLGMCKLNTPVNNAFARSLAIPNDELASLQKELEALRPSAAAGHTAAVTALGPQFQQISVLRNLERRCDDTEKETANRIVTDIYDTYLRAAIHSAGRKAMPDDIPPIHLKGADDCGCALDDLDGVVYGFYPYWWKQKDRQLNFRAINRMAYYGLTVDNTGEFRLGGNSFTLNDGSAEANQFVHTAHQYNSKVDWLIQKNDWGREWQALNPQSKRAVFNRIRENISTLLNVPLSDFSARMKRLTTFAGAPPRRGDGVTLYFPNYPEDKDSMVQFNVFYQELRTELHKHDLWLNILVTQDTLATGKNGAGGAFGLANLIDLRKLRGVSQKDVRPGALHNAEYLLVLLNEPSTDSKKTLRLALENDSRLHGADRADFLRTILPVIHFDDHNWQQLDDDIVYAHDNFGGVGFWAPDFDNLALPVKDEVQSCLESQQIVVCLLRNFREKGVLDSLPGPIEVFACLHRGLLHWTMLLLIVTGVVLLVLFFTFCNARTFIRNQLLWVWLLIILPVGLVFILLLRYDPFMLDIADGNWPLYILFGTMMLAGVGYHIWRRLAQRQTPQRERGGMPQREGMGFPILVWTIESDKGGFQWLIKNRGTGYAIIKKVEILLDGNPVADAKTALESVMESDNNVLWKSVPLVGQKLEPGRQLAGLSIPNGEAARAFEQKLKAHDLAVKITYSGPNNEQWSSDGSGIMSVSGVA